MFTIGEVRGYTKFLLALSPLAILSRGAAAIADPSLSTIGNLSTILSYVGLSAMWLHVTKGYALFAKSYGEL